LEKDKSHLT